MGSPRLTHSGFLRWLECRSYREQCELYEAAKVIQQAYRQYKARMTTLRQNETERNAAVIIQSCYRRYKQYCYFKKLHKAAVLIQKHYRIHRVLQNGKITGEEKKYGDCMELEIPYFCGFSLWKQHQAAITIQQAYRGHRQRSQQISAREIHKFILQSRRNSV